MKRLTSVGQLEWLRNRILGATDRTRSVVQVCMTGCRAYGAAEVAEALRAEIKQQGLASAVEVRSTGCHGFCAKAPVISLEPLGVQYQEVSPEDAPEIVSRTLKRSRLIERLAYRDPATGRPVFDIGQIPFYRKQERRVLANCGRIDPTQVEHYIAAGGYQGLAKALSGMTPEQVIEEVSAARLRGRGGAGFPTGSKWKFTRQAAGSPKYIICNADEGDPGAFMDRAILEGDPHAVLEGMLIGAFAMGAEHGYVYVREEYPIAVEHLTIAIGQLRELGLLGENILGTGLELRPGSQEGCRRLCVRRGNRPDGVHRRPAGHAPGAAAVSGPVGAGRKADQHQQRGDLGQRPADRQTRRTAGTAAWARKRARAPRSSPWRARSTTPVWWRCPSG